MHNLVLLARIARGERAFHVDQSAEDEDRAAFSQLVCDARRLAVAGYVAGVTRPREVGHRHDQVIEVLSPGVTPAGVAALRQAGFEVPGLADRRSG